MRIAVGRDGEHARSSGSEVTARTGTPAADMSQRPLPLTANGSSADPPIPRAPAQTSGDSAVSIRGLVKSFGANPVFDGLDLTVARGERLAILGASGCGKSTLLRCIAGLEKPERGTIAVCGDVGFVFQEPRLFPWLSVEANVAFAARDAQERARVPELIELVGLTAARRKLPKALSGGMAQRAALARALVRRPSVILLDEPLAALDALLRLELRAALRELAGAGDATSILVTHDVDEALDFAQRCIVLARSTSAVHARATVSTADPKARAVIFAALGVTTSEPTVETGQLLRASSLSP